MDTASPAQSYAGDPLRTPQVYRRSSDGNAAGDSVPFFENGTYHLFHLSVPGDSLGQQYPYRCTTQQRHAVSDDLVTWTELPTALVPGEQYDRDGCWTGCMVERDGRYHLFYTGHTAGAENPQTICLATSDDGVAFEKVADNPLLKPDPVVYEPIDFRDPFVFYNEAERCYWMLIAARLAEGPVGRRGCVALATSTDLLAWSDPEPLYSPYSTFCPECPELFELGDHWYLVYSHFSESARTSYRIADSPRGPWRMPSVPGLDGRRFYAAKSLAPDPDRRIMWGSIYERVEHTDESDWTYAGDFGAPRELRSRSDGSLTVSLPREVEDAFAERAEPEVDPQLGEWSVARGSASVDSVSTLAYALAEPLTASTPTLLTCEIELDRLGGEFGLLLNAATDLSSAYGLAFEPQAQRVVLTLWPQPLDPFWASLTSAKTPPAQIDGPRLVERPLAIAEGQRFSVRVLVEGSLVEAFVNDEVALSYRIYESEHRRPGVFAQDAGVTIHQLAVHR